MLKNLFRNLFLHSPKRTFFVLGGLVVMLSLPITILLSQQQQDLRQRAAEFASSKFYPATPEAGFDYYCDVDGLATGFYKTEKGKTTVLSRLNCSSPELLPNSLCYKYTPTSSTEQNKQIQCGVGPAFTPTPTPTITPTPTVTPTPTPNLSRCSAVTSTDLLELKDKAGNLLYEKPVNGVCPTAYPICNEWKINSGGYAGGCVKANSLPVTSSCGTQVGTWDPNHKACMSNLCTNGRCTKTIIKTGEQCLNEVIRNDPTQYKCEGEPITWCSSIGQPKKADGSENTPICQIKPVLNVTAIAGDRNVRIQWPPVSGAANYYIYWSTDISSTGTDLPPIVIRNQDRKVEAGIVEVEIFDPISNTNKTYKSATHLNRTNGTTYYYTVTAVYNDHENGAYKWASAKPNVAAPTATPTVTPTRTPTPTGTPGGATATPIPGGCDPVPSGGTINGADLSLARDEVLGIVTTRLASCMTTPNTDATTGADVAKIQDIILGISNQ